MSGGVLTGVRVFVKRNFVSVIFPIICFGSIAADYSHTKVGSVLKCSCYFKRSIWSKFFWNSLIFYVKVRIELLTSHEVSHLGPFCRTLTFCHHLQAWKASKLQATQSSWYCNTQEDMVLPSWFPQITCADELHMKSLVVVNQIKKAG